MKFIVLCFAILYTNNFVKSEITLHPDFGLNVFQLLEKYNYGSESHIVQTEDGYILGLQRITHGRNETDVNTPKPAVLVMHGLESSGVDFVNTGPDNAIALLLSDQGYDVWLGNSRGTTWSRNHTVLEPTNRLFWKFSFHEMGVYDLPATIDYILKITGQEQLTYVGHSQGTTAFFAMASMKPEYNDKIKLMAALAPVAHMNHFPHPIMSILAKPVVSLVVNLGIELLKLYDILPHSDLITEIGKRFCSDSSIFQQTCANIFLVIGGNDPAQFNNSFIPVITSNAPAGTSYRQIVHYMQEVRSGSFRQFDYGVAENIRRYNQVTPPDYDISKIKAPVGIFYSKNDYFAATEDVERLASELPNVVKQQMISWDLFSHIDYMWATDIYELVNKDVVDLVNEYNKA